MEHVVLISCEVLQKRPLTLIVSRDCYMKRPRAFSGLGEIDEVFDPQLQHLLYLHLVSFVGELQQPVDLKDLQAALCYSPTHDGLRKRLLGGKCGKGRCNIVIYVSATRATDQNAPLKVEKKMDSG